MTNNYIRLEDKIENALTDLIIGLNKEGFDVNMNDLTWELTGNSKHIGIESIKIYSKEDLPRVFGVMQGVNDPELTKTKINQMKQENKKQARRLLTLLATCFEQMTRE